MSPVISVEELFRIYRREEVVIVDASNSPEAHQHYLGSHLEKSFFVDLNKDLAHLGNPQHGGRHPLPEPQEFAKVLLRLGIHRKSRVIVYDNHFGANAAARFWWMLRAFNHQNVQVLDGGYQAAFQAGFPMTTLVPEAVNATDYTAGFWSLPRVTIQDVRAALGDSNTQIIDVREQSRYNGEFEPIDLVAGHIDGAANIPYKQNLDASGLFKSAESLRALYAEYQHQKIIVHCGSGVTACHTLLAFEVAGLEMPALYVGSWSEWSRNLGG